MQDWSYAEDIVEGMFAVTSEVLNLIIFYDQVLEPRYKQ